jgi:hypothetical protein
VIFSSARGEPSHQPGGEVGSRHGPLPTGSRATDRGN